MPTAITTSGLTELRGTRIRSGTGASSFRAAAKQRGQICPSSVQWAAPLGPTRPHSTQRTLPCLASSASEGSSMSPYPTWTVSNGSPSALR